MAIERSEFNTIGDERVNLYMSAMEKREQTRLHNERFGAVMDNFALPGGGKLTITPTGVVTEQVTKYNIQGDFRDMKTLYTVYIVDRRKIDADPTEATTQFLVVAATPEEARTTALLKSGVSLADLQFMHAASVPVSAIPFAPKLLTDAQAG